ncbi:MAG: BolA/IbaG family iron-sulfur metabolism protein [Granulosicoccus sp.]
MSTANEINDVIVEGLSPIHLEVIDESHRHNVPEGAQSHFKLVIVSDSFAGQGLVARHRVVNKLLADYLAGSVHALGLHTHTPEEWAARGESVPASPPCRGGSKSS